MTVSIADHNRPAIFCKSQRVCAKHRGHVIRPVEIMISFRQPSVKGVLFTHVFRITGISIVSGNISGIDGGK